MKEGMIEQPALTCVMSLVILPSTNIYARFEESIVWKDRFYSLSECTKEKSSFRESQADDGGR